MAREKRGGALLFRLEAEHAEWRPLLSLVESALGEMDRPVWSETASKGAMQAMAQEVLTEGRLTAAVQFMDWLAAGLRRRTGHREDARRARQS